MIINNDYQQGSMEWLCARAGIPTASEFDQLLKLDFTTRTGEMPRSYLARKLAEWWQGAPLQTFRGGDMEQGQILEADAIPMYELLYDETIERVAFITTDDKKIGCSPDGLIVCPPAGSTCGIEIKCPHADTHVRYLLGGEVPKEYLCQVHGAMYVTGFPRWKFFSYRRGFPPLVLTVERNEEFQAMIHDALQDFLAEFECAKERLCAINGGPPDRTIKLSPMTPRSERQPYHSEMPS